MKNKPTIAISPISNGYLTKGKEYDILGLVGGGMFTIKSDDDIMLFCLEEECHHLNGLNWELK